MLHVLIVDDEWLDMEGLRDQIPLSLLPPMTIHTAENGTQALEIMSRLPIDILITDITMPQIDGMQLAMIARGKHPCAEIIFVSGHDDFAYAQQAVALGAAWYLLKPVQDEELLRALLRATGRLGSGDSGQPNPAALPKTRNESLTDQVCQYVLAHLDKRIMLSNIAEELHYSPNHLGRIVQETLNMTFSAYVQKTRMQYAARLLREKQHLHIGEISGMAGYTSSDAFTRAFSQEYGFSPKEYRNHE